MFGYFAAEIDKAVVSIRAGSIQVQYVLVAFYDIRVMPF